MDFELIFVVFLLSMVIITFIILAITCIVDKIRAKRYENFRNKFFATYPELRVLLFTRKLHNDTWSEAQKSIREITDIIDKEREKMKYYPCHDYIRTAHHIENLKECRAEMVQISEEAKRLCQETTQELTKWWETNFPKVKKDKRIMWWD